jgi:type I restriction enzyme S subunit
MTILDEAAVEAGGRRKPYPEYRDSGLDWLGEVPAHWEVRRLKSLATIRASNVDKKSVDGQEPVALCNYTDVYNREVITPDREFMAATATPEQIRRFSLRRGDVLVTKDSESWTDIAVPAYIAADMPDVLCGYHLALIRPRVGVEGGYLARAFAASEPRHQFRVAANGITRYGLDTGSIKAGRFPTPSIDEQRAIVVFLDRETARIDALIAKKERLIELLAEQRASIVAEAVTSGIDPSAPRDHLSTEWLRTVPRHWHETRLGYLGNVIGGMTPSTSDQRYWNGSVPWVTPKDMKRPVIDSSEDTITDLAVRETGLAVIEPPAVLFVVRGMILAHSFPVAVTSVAVTVNQDMKALRLRDGANPFFLRALFSGLASAIVSTMVDESSHGTKALRLDRWRRFPLYLPPIAEQHEIVEHLEHETKRIDALMTKVRDHIALLREYRVALISAAVTGRIDVRDVVAA